MGQKLSTWWSSPACGTNTKYEKSTTAFVKLRTAFFSYKIPSVIFEILEAVFGFAFIYGWFNLLFYCFLMINRCIESASCVKRGKICPLQTTYAELPYLCVRSVCFDYLQGDVSLERGRSPLLCAEERGRRADRWDDAEDACNSHVLTLTSRYHAFVLIDSCNTVNTIGASLDGSKPCQTYLERPQVSDWVFIQPGRARERLQRKWANNSQIQVH